MGRLVIHIGPHKTGTTALQQWLTNNERALERSGWSYPPEGRGPEPPYDRHDDLALNATEYFAGDGVRGTAMKTLRQRVASGNVVLSCESWSMATAASLVELTQALGAPRAEIVFVERDPLERIRSVWAERVKSGLVSSLAEFVTPHLDRPRASTILNAGPRLRRIDGEDRLELRMMSYEALRARDALLQAFAEKVLGVPFFESRHDGRANVSPSLELLEFLRVASIREGSGDGAAAIRRRRVLEALPAGDRRAIEALVRERGVPAKRAIVVRRDTPAMRELRTLGAREFREAFVGPVAAPPDDFSPLRWAYYDAEPLLADPAILARIDEVNARTSAAAGMGIAKRTWGFLRWTAGRVR